MSRIYKIGKIVRMKKAVLDDITLILLIVLIVKILLRVHRVNPSRINKINKIFRIKTAVLDDITLILLILSSLENPA
ncbi:hypothetical protein C6495_10960 [Candidatus Poribacteria bacterium]|nr:MAG: hypothetical protein C6495_10960 [Candidatus Poribacteria bacterium]